MVKKALIVLASSAGLLVVSNAQACGLDGYGSHRYSPFAAMGGSIDAVAGQSRIDARTLDEERARRNLTAKLSPSTTTEPTSDAVSTQQPADEPSSATETFDQNLFR
jgi:hypothetical protein